MKNLSRYREACLKYLYSRVLYFTEPVDELMDRALRVISELPMKPEGDDEYNGTLGMVPVVDQRKLCVRLLQQRLKLNSVHQTDLLLDEAVRKLNNLPERPKGDNPYEALFTLTDVKEDPLEEPKEVTGMQPASNFKTSKVGINLIHSFESYRECTYKDPGSNNGLPITGGWGSTRLNGKKLQLGQCYSKEVWDKQFEHDLKYFEDAVKKYVKVPINQQMFDSLVSFTYNCGVAALSGSTAIRRLNKKDYEGAAEAMTWWSKGGNGKVLAGLVRRRKEEKELFLS